MLFRSGAHVKRDDVIAELETDKVILEIPAPHDGVLSNIIVSEGSTVTSAQLLAHLKPQAVIEETVTPVTETLAMPSARLEAQRSGVELADVAGSGRNGRILKAVSYTHLDVYKRQGYDLRRLRSTGAG